MQRIAIIYDDRPRPETTGVYCRRALEELVREGRIASVQHLLPDMLEHVRPDTFDLSLVVDDGLTTSIPSRLRPAAFWAIDTHLEFERCLGLARQADFTFAAQRDGAERLRQAGIASATWLPLACDPELHGRRNVPPQFDVCFIGNLFPERERLVDVIRQRYPNTFVGRRYFAEMAEAYSGARCAFNRSLDGDVNMRVFEALCSGALLVTNDLTHNGQTELFRDGVHLATYADDEELLDKLGYYLEHDDERERIAASGRQEAIARHTYRHRMETILKAVADSPAKPQPTNGSAPVRAAVAAKDRTYFEFDRPDVLELIPTTARRVLDVGCGTGRLGVSLKARQACEVAGIELDPDAASEAGQRLDAVRVGNIEEDAITFSDGEFDCVICADVLEHLRDPAAVLRKVRRWLAADGCLVTSVPNVRNHTVVESLLAGNWTYETAGLLDADHVRFFTRRELEKLLFRSGLEMDELRMVPGEGYGEWLGQGEPLQVSVGGLQIRAGSREDAAEFFAYQYLARSRVTPVREHGLTSIILVTHNQLAYTKQCVDSIRLRTDEPYELICVDNGSTDGTPDYLRSLSGATVIVNGENRGFPAAVNQGLAAARGDNLLLLNNDTIVTTGWLRRMLDVLHSEERIGLVGPVSNNVSGEQRIAVGYDAVTHLDGWAWDYQRQHAGQLSETDRLVGFCLLFKRAVLDAIGLLDERFGIGCFEDDDFCRRASTAGYQAVIAHAAFVHHFGSVTFRASGVDFAGVLAESRRLYEEKWGAARSDGTQERCAPDRDGGGVNGTLIRREPAPAPPGRPRPAFIVANVEGEGGGLRLAPNTLKLSVCLIVRDNADTIRPCLESIKPWVDEIVVVDTGSHDETPRICEELGARVFHWAWRDDFAAARNVSLDHARGEWLFWMDSDDTIAAECGRKLRELVDRPHVDNVLGYVVQVHCPGREPGEKTVVDHVKLIRNRPDLRFVFRIHEQVLPAIRRAGGDVAWSDLYVVHSGSDQTEAGRERKLARDFRLLELELADLPEHPFVLFNLGMTHADAGQHTEAIDYLQRCVRMSQPHESHVRKAYALLVRSLSQSGQKPEAWERCLQGLELYPSDKELLFRRAMLEHESGRLEAAAATYRRILDERTERHFTSVDAGIAGAKARHNLAIVYEDLGWTELAERERREIWNNAMSYGAGQLDGSAVTRLRRMNGRGDRRLPRPLCHQNGSGPRQQNASDDATARPTKELRQSAYRSTPQLSEEDSTCRT